MGRRKAAILGQHRQRRHGVARDEQSASQPGSGAGQRWILARNGADAALVTPWGYQLRLSDQQRSRGLSLYRPARLPAGSYGAHQGSPARYQKMTTLVLADRANTLTLTVTGPDNKDVFQKDLPVSAHGTVTADLDLASDAALGYYNMAVRSTAAQMDAGNGSFYVEEYKKPEYQVTVKPAGGPRSAGQHIQATIEARYFFGEPVAGAKVTYVVHTSSTTGGMRTTRTIRRRRCAGRHRRTGRFRQHDGGRPSSRSTRACSMRTADSRSAAHARSTTSTTTRTIASRRV